MGKTLVVRVMKSEMPATFHKIFGSSPLISSYLLSVKTSFFLFLLLSVAYSTQAQNLSGIWKGRLGMSGGCFAENNLEIQLQVKGDSVWGSCYQFETINYYVKKNITGKYNRATKKLTLNEGIVTTFHIHDHCSICVKNFYLTFEKNGKIETLYGDWDGKVLGSGNKCSVGPIVLYRAKESAFREVPEIIVDTGKIRLDFYDNALVDGDSITVMVDKNIVVSHQKLNTKPITTYITIDQNQTFHEVEMVAENLGSIPPNTAMLIITSGNKRYQLYLTSTQSKSAMVRFVYDKKEKLPENQ